MKDEREWARSLETEQSVLGALLIDNSSAAKVVQILSAEDFSDARHATIYRAILALLDRKQPADYLTLTEELRRRKANGHDRLPGYIARLAAETPSAQNVVRYAEMVREKSLCRRLDAFGLEVQTEARRPGARDLRRDVAELGGRLRRIEEAIAGGLSLRALGAPELLEIELPELKSLLEPILSEKNLAMIHARRGVGKTHLALGISFAIAAGLPFLCWRAPRPRGVLYLDGEMPAQLMQRRLRQYASAHGEVPKLLRVVTPDMQERPMPDLGTLSGQEEIDALVLDETALIVVDNLSCLVRSGGAENEAESWGMVAEWALKHRRAGRAVLFIHHSGKSGAQRGTSKREDLLDVVINLRRPPEYRESDGAAFCIHFEKARSLIGDEVAPIEARLESRLDGAQAWTWKPATTASGEQIRELWEVEGMTLIDVAREAGVNKSTAARELQRAMQAGELKRSYPSRPRKKHAN